MLKELLKAAGANDISEMNWDTDISPIETLLVQQLLSRRVKPMKTIDIYFSDLTQEKQVEMLKAVGANNPSEMNWDMDILPIATFDFEEDC